MWACTPVHLFVYHEKLSLWSITYDHNHGTPFLDVFVARQNLWLLNYPVTTYDFWLPSHLIWHRSGHIHHTKSWIVLISSKWAIALTDHPFISTPLPLYQQFPRKWPPWPSKSRGHSHGDCWTAVPPIWCCWSMCESTCLKQIDGK